MDQPDKIPSLPDLALRYGTVTPEQFSHIMRLYALKIKLGHPVEFDHLLLSQKFATAYQVGLLRLIREYLIVKKHGEEFGKIAIEKGFATQVDVDRALAQQKKAFKQAKIKKLIGDILVEAHVITEKQKYAILKEQTFLDTRAGRILGTDAAPQTIEDGQDIEQADGEKSGPSLSEYEKQFLQIKILDREFAASVLEKGLASEKEVKTAQTMQENAFEKKAHIQSLGSIMVELDYISQEQNELILKEQNRSLDGKKLPQGPAVTVRISEDSMEAEVSIVETEQTVNIELIKNALDEQGVRHGIYPDAILQCNLDLNNKTFIAAKQDFSMEMIKSRRAAYRFNTDSIDDVEKKKGETLALQGINCDTFLKKDLFGNHIEDTGDEGFTFRCGSGARLSRDGTKAFAGKTGFPSLSIEKRLFIHPIINVLEDADLRYGPLEAYANLNISGVLTGAYPVTAGRVQAEEIRGARIEAVGDVISRVGITDAIISAQGDIRARYLHNCRIETFGNVYIENEIIDSQVFSSGKIDCGNCHAVSSGLYGKKGIELGGAGNQRTKPCILGAGTEHHVLEKAAQMKVKVKSVRKKLDEYIEERDAQDNFSKKIFQKMIELKIFHDRAKNKKEKLTQEFKKKKNLVGKEKLKNIVKLINNFDRRMKSTVSTLKELNKTKKKYENDKTILEKKIKQLEPRIEKEVNDLRLDLFACFEWARKEQNIPQIKINKKIYPGTLLCGIFSSLQVEQEMSNTFISEKKGEGRQYKITIRKN